MARQKEDRALSAPEEFGAIDPGDVHVGYAAMRFKPETRRYELRMGVLHRRERTLTETVNDVLAQMPARVIIENYRARPVGHQQFNAGETLRLIGALEYATQLPTSARRCFFEPPGNPDHDLPKLKLSPIIDKWIEVFGEVNPNWRHAYAAWRALGMYVMRNDFALLDQLVYASMQNMSFRLYPSPKYARGTHEDARDCVITPITFRV